MPAHTRQFVFFFTILPCALILAVDSLFGRYMAIMAHQNPLVISGFGYLGATLLIISISRLWIGLAKQEPPPIRSIVTNTYSVLYGVVHILQVTTILFQLSLMSAFDATLVARLSIPIFIAQGFILGRKRETSVNIMAIILAVVLVGIIYASVKSEDILAALAATMAMSILWIIRGYVAQKTPRGETFSLNLYAIGWTQFTGSILFISALILVGLSPLGNISGFERLLINNWFNQDSWWVLMIGSGLIWPLVVIYLLWTPQKAPDSFQMMLAFLPVLVLVLENAMEYLGIMPAPSHSAIHYMGSLIVLGITLIILYRGWSTKKS